jgi:hypothetical protein
MLGVSLAATVRSAVAFSRHIPLAFRPLATNFVQQRFNSCKNEVSQCPSFSCGRVLGRSTASLSIFRFVDNHILNKITQGHSSYRTLSTSSEPAKKEGEVEKKPKYKGKNMFDILGLLDNFGVGWRLPAIFLIICFRYSNTNFKLQGVAKPVDPQVPGILLDHHQVHCTPFHRQPPRSPPPNLSPQPASPHPTGSSSTLPAGRGACSCGKGRYSSTALSAASTPPPSASGAISPRTPSGPSSSSASPQSPLSLPLPPPPPPLPPQRESRPRPLLRRRR